MEAYQLYFSTGNNTTHITCCGDLTIRNAKDILSEFIVENEYNNTLFIELKDVEFIDLTFLQILVSIIKEHSKDGSNSFQFKYQLEEEHLELLFSTGFIDIIKSFQTHNNHDKK